MQQDKIKNSNATNNNKSQEEYEHKYIEEPICTVNGETITKKYLKIKKVGEGSYSKCYLVKNATSESEYVVKIIPKKKLELLVKEKLVYEIKIQQLLSHPNVVHLDHWFEDEEYQYIFMEYCSEGVRQITIYGQNLQKKLQDSSKMSEKDIKRYVKQIVEAIMYIHSKNILHRDLKLCNFYFDSNHNIKLGDFGFACQLSHHAQLKRQTCGTPNYIAPEAVSGFGYSFSSDVWAVAVILYRLKFKCCPFEGKSVKETLEKVKTVSYSFPKGQKISSELKDLIEKIFIINYDERLSLEQILNHKFFEEEKSKRSNSLMRENEKKQVKIEERGFSLKKLFTKDKEPQRSKKEQQNDSKAKRSNSCQTLKQIKEIFKNKSKTNIQSHQTQIAMTTDMKTEENHSSLHPQYTTQTGRERMSYNNTNYNNTMRNIVQNSWSVNLFSQAQINKKEESRGSRLNNFIGNVKEQIKMQHKTNLLMQSQQGQKGINQAQMSSLNVLSSLMKKYYLPYEVQYEKDVMIVHYKESIKQIFDVGHSRAYMMHRQKQLLYEMNGSMVVNPSKVLKYIIDNKVAVAEEEPEEAQFGSNTIEKILLFVSHKYYINKEGIILRYGNAGTSSTLVAKMFNQTLFYICTLTNHEKGIETKDENKMILMYLREGKTYKTVEGVVIAKIYQGWVTNTLKMQSQKQ